MDIDCHSVRQRLADFSLVRDCDRIRNGMLRIATALQYPDGSNIDLFLGQPESLFPEIELSDLGQTTAYLLNLHVRPLATKKRRQIVADICEALGAQEDRGRLLVRLEPPEEGDLADAIMRLGQACLRVADLALTQRFRMVNPFREEVEEFLEGTGLRYEADVSLAGRFARDVEVEFQVTGRTVTSLVQTLSTGHPPVAHTLCNEVFRRWYDVWSLRNGNQFLTVFDSRTDVFRADDSRDVLFNAHLCLQVGLRVKRPICRRTRRRRRRR